MSYIDVFMTSSSTSVTGSASPAFGGVSPILRVQSLAASLDYYLHVLRFKLDWQDDRSTFASVSRGRCCILLCQGDQGHPGNWIWIGVEDVISVFQEYRASGAKIRNPPSNYPWALEMQIEDLDGNVLRAGSDSKAGEPWGEWLDMYGDRWHLSANDSWVRSTPV